MTHGASGATHLPALASETSHTIGAAQGVASGRRQSSWQVPNTQASPGFEQSVGAHEAPVLDVPDAEVLDDEVLDEPPAPGFVESTQPAATAQARTIAPTCAGRASCWLCTDRRIPELAPRRGSGAPR